MDGVSARLTAQQMQAQPDLQAEAAEASRSSRTSISMSSDMSDSEIEELMARPLPAHIWNNIMSLPVGGGPIGPDADWSTSRAPTPTPAAASPFPQPTPRPSGSQSGSTGPDAATSRGSPTPPTLTAPANNVEGLLTNPGQEHDISGAAPPGAEMICDYYGLQRGALFADPTGDAVPPELQVQDDDDWWALQANRVVEGDPLDAAASSSYRSPSEVLNSAGCLSHSSSSPAVSMVFSPVGADADDWSPSSTGTITPRNERKAVVLATGENGLPAALQSSPDNFSDKFLKICRGLRRDTRRTGAGAGTRAGRRGGGVRKLAVTRRTPLSEETYEVTFD